MKLALYILTLITVSLSILTLSLSPQTVTAQSSKDAACEGVKLTGGGGCDDTAGTSVNSLIATVINLFSWIVGVTAVIMVIVGGFRYVISSGDSAQTSSAKNTILFAIIGLAIVALAQVIVRFVLNKV